MIKNNIMIKNKIISAAGRLIATITVFLGAPKIVFAQITNPAVGEWGQPGAAGITDDKFATLFIKFWNIAIMVGAIGVIVMFLWGAIEWILSGGDSNKVQSAQKRITNAVIGLILLVASFVILDFISYALFGDEFDLLNLSI